MKKNIIYALIVLLLVGGILFLTFGKEIVKPSYMNITGKEAVKLVNDGAIVLDVRTQEEYKKKHIPNAINLPVEYINKIDFTSEKPIIVYCQSGNRSKKAAAELIKIGFTNVYNLGSIDNWTGEFE